MEFDSCQGKVIKLTKSERSVRGKSCKGKLFIVDLTFGVTPAFTGIVVAW